MQKGVSNDTTTKRIWYETGTPGNNPTDWYRIFYYRKYGRTGRHDYVKEIKKLIGELGKIGSNLNQIARYFNQGGIISSEMRTEIKKSLRDIYEMKYEVMRMAGDFRGSD